MKRNVQAFISIVLVLVFAGGEPSWAKSQTLHLPRNQEVDSALSSDRDEALPDEDLLVGSSAGAAEPETLTPQTAPNALPTEQQPPSNSYLETPEQWKYAVGSNRVSLAVIRSSTVVDNEQAARTNCFAPGYFGSVYDSDWECSIGWLTPSSAVDSPQLDTTKVVEDKTDIVIVETGGEPLLSWAVDYSRLLSQDVLWVVDGDSSSSVIEPLAGLTVASTEEFTNGETPLSTRQIAGMAAIIRSHNHQLGAKELKQCIVNTLGEADLLAQGLESSAGNDGVGHEDCGLVPPVPGSVDIVFSFDLTASMGAVLAEAQTEMEAVMLDLQARWTQTDFRFAVTSHDDYSITATGSECEITSYTAQYGSPQGRSGGQSSDQPFRIDQGLSGDPALGHSTIGTLSLGSGSDRPESYGRALWEIGQADTGAKLGFRDGSLKLVVSFGDGIPHDPDLHAQLPLGGIKDTGIDPGRNGRFDCGGDDIDFQDDALQSLIGSDIRLLHVDTNGEFEHYWRPWAASTGGAYAAMKNNGLPQTVSALVESALSAG